MSIKILIVEDDTVCGHILQKIIINLGYISLGIVKAAENTIFSVEQDMPDIVLMDINLSGLMDGIHTAEILTGYYNIPIIFITSNADAKSISRAKQIGAGYIIKPFTDDEIKKAIANVLENDNKNKENFLEKSKDIPKILVKTGERIIFLSLYDIHVLEAQGHKVLLHTKDEIYQIRGSLKHFESLDLLKLFFRCHKSFLVQSHLIKSLKVEKNYFYKVKIGDSEILIPVSKQNVRRIKNLI